QKYGILVDQYALDTSDAGAGEFRGGLGLVRDYRVMGDQGMYLTTTFGRFKYVPWGVDGGRSGSPNYIELIPGDGSARRRFGKAPRRHGERGGAARLVPGGGGGGGDPRPRPGEKVLRDVEGGYITAEAARMVYGQDS